MNFRRVGFRSLAKHQWLIFFAFHQVLNFTTRNSIPNHSATTAIMTNKMGSQLFPGPADKMQFISSIFTAPSFSDDAFLKFKKIIHL